MTDFAYITVKLASGLAGLWIITRLLGKKEISQLTAFDFVSSLMLSEIVGNTLYDRDVGLEQLLYALALWTVMSLALEKLVQYVPWLSKPLNGTADLIIDNGRIDWQAMKRNNLDFDQLLTMLREQSVFSIREVAFAVFETNGSISVMKRTEADSVTRKDLRLPDVPMSLPVVLIENGHIRRQRLEALGRDEAWLFGELQAAGIGRPQDVLYAEWTDHDGLYCQQKPETAGQ
ncbi:DUF421 domain-containing protein [Paenibacillus elgii]|uniref:DUF421 domain-containing protein n=1 Tax=Paenibacillus elgii TaxID=189691 RepID=UPI000FDC62F9|nr:DUF421 domain-containing protein [Paenibacillus elgii]NEN85914.1 DUF421 domain-containing protein [Paenibacillus elgii]